MESKNKAVPEFIWVESSISGLLMVEDSRWSQVFTGVVQETDHVILYGNTVVIL